jgi:hypothetical protein
MAKRGDRLFAADKIEWMLSGGLETMDPGERQMLLVMAETKIQDGYKPSAEEKRVVDKLRALAGDEYDARDIRKKVKTMVKGRKTTAAPPLHLPPVFDRLIKRVRSRERDSSLAGHKDKGQEGTDNDPG